MPFMFWRRKKKASSAVYSFVITEVVVEGRNVSSRPVFSSIDALECFAEWTKEGYSNVPDENDKKHVIDLCRDGVSVAVLDTLYVT